MFHGDQGWGFLDDESSNKLDEAGEALRQIIEFKIWGQGWYKFDLYSLAQTFLHTGKERAISYTCPAKVTPGCIPGDWCCSHLGVGGENRRVPPLVPRTEHAAPPPPMPAHLLQEEAEKSATPKTDGAQAAQDCPEAA